MKHGRNSWSVSMPSVFLLMISLYITFPGVYFSVVFAYTTWIASKEEILVFQAIVCKASPLYLINGKLNSIPLKKKSYNTGKGIAISSKEVGDLRPRFSCVIYLNCMLCLTSFKSVSFLWPCHYFGLRPCYIAPFQTSHSCQSDPSKMLITSSLLMSPYSFQDMVQAPHRGTQSFSWAAPCLTLALRL